MKKRVLGRSDLKVSSLGYPDETAPANSTRMGRASLAESVTFHDE